VPDDTQTPPTPPVPPLAPPVANPWSTAPVAAAKPFLLNHLSRCRRNNITAATITLVVVPTISVIGFEPFFANVTSLRLILITIAAAIIAPIWAIATLIKNLKWASNPYSHPALNWQEVGQPQQVVEMIDADFYMTEYHEKIGPALFTPSWLLKYSNWHVDAVPFVAIVWAYKHVTVNKSYGITTGKTYSLHLYSRSGQKFEVTNVKEQQVNEILVNINRRAPWAIIGFSKELEATWNKSRAQMIQQVDARRYQYHQKAAEAAEAAENAAVAPPVPAYDL